MTVRDRIYSFSRTLSSRFLFLGIYYTAFFFLFFVLSGETIFTFSEHLAWMQALSAVAMGAGFSVMHWWMFRKRR